MSISDDIPPSDDFPPPRSLPYSVKKTLSKISNVNEFSDYLDHICAYHAYHLDDVTHELQERLMLQGLDEDDLFTLHVFLGVEYENGILTSKNHNITKKQGTLLANQLKQVAHQR
ncbi:hypothetical protein GF369_01690 [Candidatus Peregrinibacteria bacterium]|nr:hypothetical protein [Candidatus Peregrinibacteria bacterium]